MRRDVICVMKRGGGAGFVDLKALLYVLSLRAAAAVQLSSFCAFVLDKSRLLAAQQSYLTNSLCMSSRRLRIVTCTLVAPGYLFKTSEVG